MRTHDTPGPNQASTPRQKRRWRRWGQHLLLLGAALLAIELLALALFPLVTSSWFSWRRMHRRRLAVLEQEQDTWSSTMPLPAWARANPEVIHPYVGYVIDPTDPRAAGVHELGFHDLDEALEPPRSDRLIVAIFGGSVAGQLWEARSFIEEELHESPALQGIELHIIRVALAGYKQPQPALALQYLLSLGAHFDVVIAFDGFNDIVLPWFDNASHGVFPYYPRSWSLRTANVTDIGLLRDIGAVEYYGSLRLSCARFMSASWMRFSVAANLVWSLLDTTLEHTITVRRRTIADEQEHGSYLRTGPGSTSSTEEVLAESARVWERSSLAMLALSRQHHIVYLHFLQPNQYVEASKPLSAIERRECYRLDQGYGPIARAGYPFLIDRGARLVQEGVAFYDLTMIFADEPRTLYADACCHFNQLGKELVGRRVGEIVRQTLEQSTPADAAH